VQPPLNPEIILATIQQNLFPYHDEWMHYFCNRIDWISFHSTSIYWSKMLKKKSLWNSIKQSVVSVCKILLFIQYRYYSFQNLQCQYQTVLENIFPSTLFGNCIGLERRVLDLKVEIPGKGRHFFRPAR
jgi:hypothetical protein